MAFNNYAALGCEGYIFNLKKHVADANAIHRDYIKDYEYLYHLNMKTAHLDKIFINFIAPAFTEDAINYINALQPRIIQRFGCGPCVVKYRAITYTQLAWTLSQQANPHAFRTFVINYGNNV